MSTTNWEVISGTIGDGWLAIARLIIERGDPGSYEQRPILELLQTTVRIEHPQSEDPVIDRHADPERLAWMHANFHDHERVVALGDADSYATRLYNYERSGRDQLAWVVDRLRHDPSCRSATITTLQPLTDSTYIPCVSLLDFYLVHERLHLIATCHSIDFGAKGYGNLVELAFLMEKVAGELQVPLGVLTMAIKSAHVYEADMDYVNNLLMITH